MTQPTPLKQQVLHSLKWVALGKVATQIIRWIITFWVIRLLTPEDYGVVAMADVFFGFLTLIVSSLFAPGIIQNKNLTEVALKQTFGVIIVVYSTLFILQIFLADLAGAYYQSEVVPQILKVNAFCFLILALEIIPSSLLAREMEFKKVSIISAISNIVAAISTLSLAYLGYGFWSLIYGEIISIGIRTFATLLIKPINFLPSFRINEIKLLLKFGGFLSFNTILVYIFLHMDVAIAGRYMSPVEIGLFAIGLQFALMPQKKILPIIRQVAFPAFSKIQDQPERITKYIIKAQKLSLLITIPIFWGLASVVDVVIPLILGDKWVEAIIPTMVILLIMPLRFSEELFVPALKSLGKVSHMVKNILILIAIMLGCILYSVQYGAIGLAFAWAIGFPLGFIIVLKRNSRILNIKLSSIGKLFIAPTLSGLGMILSVFAVKYLAISGELINIASQMLIGGFTYLILLYILEKNSILEMKSLLKRDS